MEAISAAVADAGFGFGFGFGSGVSSSPVSEATEAVGSTPDSGHNETGSMDDGPAWMDNEAMLMDMADPAAWNESAGNPQAGPAVVEDTATPPPSGYNNTGNPMNSYIPGMLLRKRA